MIFEITETRYDFTEKGNAEVLMQQHYESQGYKVLNNNFAVVYNPSTTKYPDSQRIVDELFDSHKLEAMRHFGSCVFPGDGVHGVNPGQPDLLVYKPDMTEVFFSEVKTGSDTLKQGQMVGISVLTTFLGCRIEIARVNGKPRSHRWAWPGLLPLHPVETIQL
jgi:hypothetical protein